MTKDGKGRGIFATDFIKEGTVIIREKPIIYMMKKHNFKGFKISQI